jgi:hypothetical protein
MSSARTEEKLTFGIFEKSESISYQPGYMNIRGLNTYVMYKPEGIDILLNNVEKDIKNSSSNGKNVSRDGYIIVRFLVRQNGDLVLGEEGDPSGSIPAHAQLSIDPGLFNFEKPENFSEFFNNGKFNCIAAGNAFFNKDHELCQINQKSGDYRLPFVSLQFGINAFFSNPHIKFADELTVMDTRSHARFQLKTKEYLPIVTLDSKKEKSLTINDKVNGSDYKHSSDLSPEKMIRKDALKDSKQLAFDKTISSSQTHGFFSHNIFDSILNYLNEIAKSMIGLLIPMPLTLWELSQADKQESYNHRMR